MADGHATLNNRKFFKPILLWVTAEGVGHTENDHFSPVASRFCFFPVFKDTKRVLRMNSLGSPTHLRQKLFSGQSTCFDQSDLSFTSKVFFYTNEILCLLCSCLLSLPFFLITSRNVQKTVRFSKVFIFRLRYYE